MLNKFIPKTFFDTHIHSSFPKVDESSDISFWKEGAMLSGYFFDTGLYLRSLKNIYPFKDKSLNAFVIPIPYGPFDPLFVNENLIENEGSVDGAYLVLRGDVEEERLGLLEKQIKSNRKVIGLKLYQNYDFKYSLSFLKKILSPKLLKLVDKNGLSLFIHCNNVAIEAIKFLGAILREYRNIRIVLTHAALRLTDYNSFDYNDSAEFETFLLNEQNLKNNEKIVENYREKALNIVDCPRLYVNNALMSNEVFLYPILNVLLPEKRVIFGSDLPFAYASRIVSERKPYSSTASKMMDLYGGKEGPKYSVQYENLLFFVERIYNVAKFIDVKKVKEWFSDIFYKLPKKFI